MSYQYKYDYRSETAFIREVKEEEEVVKCSVCLEEVESKNKDSKQCDFCLEYLNDKNK